MAAAQDKKPHILLVEDEWLVASEAAKSIESVGARVIGPASSVDSALTLLNTFRVDAALLDINLNGQMAFAVAEALDKQSCPYAFVSGYPRSIAPAHFAHCLFFEKPADFKAVLQILLSAGAGRAGP